MNINATFILQLLHVGIAYIIIKRLLFLPWLRIIRQEDHHIQHIQQEITTVQQRILTQQQFRQQQWQEFEQFAASHTPKIQEIMPSLYHFSLTPGKPLHIQSTLIERYITDTQTFLVNTLKS